MYKIKCEVRRIVWPRRLVVAYLKESDGSEAIYETLAEAQAVADYEMSRDSYSDYFGKANYSYTPVKV